MKKWKGKKRGREEGRRGEGKKVRENGVKVMAGRGEELYVVERGGRKRGVGNGEREMAGREGERGIDGVERENEEKEDEEEGNGGDGGGSGGGSWHVAERGVRI